MFFTFSRLCKWHQIAQSVSNIFVVFRKFQKWATQVSSFPITGNPPQHSLRLFFVKKMFFLESQCSITFQWNLLCHLLVRRSSILIDGMVYFYLCTENSSRRVAIEMSLAIKLIIIFIWLFVF